MVINNGNLLKVDVQDLDEHGRVVIPSGVVAVTEDAFVGLDAVTEIVFSEGVELVYGYALSDLPNLKSVKFPKSLKVLGGEHGYGPAVFNTKGVKVSMQSYPQFSKDCFGKQETIEYIKNCFQQIESLLKSSSVEDIEQAIECYNSIIHHKQHYKDLAEDFDNISYLIINKLREKQDGKEIGKILIEKSLKNNKLLTPALLQYDAYSVCEHLSLQESFKLIDFRYCDKYAMLVDGTHEIYFDIGTMQIRTQKLTGKKEVDVLEQNLIMLHVLRHEISHLYQKTRSETSTNETEKLAYLDYMVQSADDGFVSGNVSNRIAEHDFFPDEIDADIKALSLLCKDLIEDYGFKEKSTRAYIERHKEQRMQMVYDKYNIQPGEDYRLVIIEEAINSGRLSKTEQEKLKRIHEEYLTIISVCNV